MATVHIESEINDIAKVVLMPGDPKRSEYIAKNYLKDYKLVNSVRGMTAYTGYYKDKLVTIFPSGMGMPSMGIYSYELFNFYNVENIIRIGSCGAYDSSLNLKDIILVDKSVSDSTYGVFSRGFKGNMVDSSYELNKVLESTAIENNTKLKKGNIYCSDAFYEAPNDYNDRVRDYGALGIEMETFALFNNAIQLGKRASALLTVSDLFFSNDKLTIEDREKNLNDMIVLALESCLKL